MGTNVSLVCDQSPIWDEWTFVQLSPEKVTKSKGIRKPYLWLHKTRHHSVLDPYIHISFSFRSWPLHEIWFLVIFLGFLMLCRSGTWARRKKIHTIYTPMNIVTQRPDLKGSRTSPCWVSKMLTTKDQNNHHVLDLHFRDLSPPEGRSCSVAWLLCPSKRLCP